MRGQQAYRRLGRGRVGAAAALALCLGSGLPAQPPMRALPTTADAPADNPTTAEKIALGRLLFWDPILSGHKDVACATCHHPDFGYAEPLDVSIGAHGQGLGTSRTFTSGQPARFVKRNSQTLLNTAVNGITASGTYEPATAPMFWDVRTQGLEAQALEPIKAMEEMRGTAYSEDDALATVVSRLTDNREYQTLFARAFGMPRAVSAENIGRALAAFQRSLLANNAPFDRYVRGDSSAMSAAQIRGMATFQAVGCSNCHSGPMFSDYRTHVLAVPENAKLAVPDSGVKASFAFRTASLRNLAYSAPYMHNGTIATLPQVVQFYTRAGRGGGRGRGGGGAPDGTGGRGGGRGGFTQNPHVTRAQLDPLLFQLRLRGGRQDDLLAFLDALNDREFDRTVPSRVPSGLKVGGAIGR
ncbi:MAG: cytochrome-c peroxidase [Gemmatimonadaceae bacterium]|nr:cytochrome-c peroxidase [Gemmatimonadaceae bacterium]